MSLPSEISDLAKQLQAKLGEAFVGHHFSFAIGYGFFSLIVSPENSFAPVFQELRPDDPASLVAAAMERAKGANG